MKIFFFNIIHLSLFLKLHIWNHKYYNRIQVFNNYCEFPNCTHKFKWLFCSEILVSNDGIEDVWYINWNNLKICYSKVNQFAAIFLNTTNILNFNIHWIRCTKSDAKIYIFFLMYIHEIISNWQRKMNKRFQKKNILALQNLKRSLSSIYESDL